VLRTLVLRDFVLVASARLELRPGLNVLTGETGAGKSLLVDALGLLTGVRAEAGLIRRGADRALVEAEFDDPSPLVASRALVANGRNHARLDGELVTVAELADAVGRRVSIFAQHAHQALLSSAAQRAALDRLLAPDGRQAASDWAGAWTERREVAAELDRLRDEARERLQRTDLLDLQIEEIDAAALRPGEEDDLAAEARRLRHADRIAGAVGRALAAIDDEDGAADGLAAARRELDDAVRLDERLAPLARDLSDALQAARAIAAELAAQLDEAAAEPDRLDRVEARLARLQRLFAKYGDGSAAVLEHRDRAARERAGLDADDRRVRELEDRLERLDARLAEAGGRLRAARLEAAGRLSSGTAPLLARLALPGARLEARVDPADPGPSGADRVRFDFAADAGEPLAPLAGAASGGELSRLMLALWLVTGASTPTLVFDEVDAGVGGRAAAAVGDLLAELGRRHQVLVVTHLPQVAAHGAHHLQVGKEERDGRTVTTVAPLDPAERERELARMLAGHEGDAPRTAARDLLARADRARDAAQGSASRPAKRAARSERSE
jgi:DNA repair protein RecN (Recombination protein N)